MGKLKYLMTIDAGTGSGRAVIFDEQANQVGIGQKEWSHLSDKRYPGSMNFDCEANWKLLTGCIKEAIANAGISGADIAAVTSSSMREGIVLYDKAGKELWAVANVDSRAGKQVAYLKSHFKGIEEKFYKKSGQTFALGALPRIMWVKEHEPKLYEKTAKVSMISDWVLFKLCGEIVSEPSNAGTSGVFSLKKREWDGSMAKQVGLKDDIFPKCLESGEVIGKVSKFASEQTGLSEQTLVVLGGGDVQLGAAGLGIVNANECAVLGGTFWQQIVNMAEPKVHKKMDVRVNPHVVAGLTQAETITFFSGMIVRWFRDAFCEQEKAQAIAKGVDTYTILEQLAASVPVGSNGIMAIFSDEMKYGKWYHAAPSLLNLSLDPTLCSKAAIFRSLQENAALVSAINLQKTFEFSGVSSDEIVFAGGASKGFLWPQILADATGLKVKTPVVKEATSLGGAFFAGVAAGIYGSVQEAAKKFVKWDKSYEPNRQNHKIYTEIKQKWQKAYKAQLKLVDEGVTNSMWKAPGI